MTCQAILNPPKTTLRPDQTVAQAMAILFAEHRLSLPVVDEKGRYRGMFGIHRLLGLALPKAAGLDQAPHLAFVSDRPDDIRARLKAVADQPLSRHLDETVHPIRPTTPLVETLLLLYRSRDDLPVVDDQSGTLVGVVSLRDALDTLAKGA
ncbi:MAG: CBS domain-containing protein [Rhodospirillales bacterium]|nr:CBS domain-containing protein [Rhodospirillales bacterium]